MKNTILIQLLFLVSISNFSQNPEAPSWLDYTTKRTNNDMKNSVLLDYSFAGYQFSEKELPDVSSWNTISVLDFGAIPNDATYDDDAIYAAIEAAKIANVPTVIYFPAGRYIVSSETTKNSPFIIDKSYIVLKGAGSGTGGTEIYTDKFGDNLNGSDYPWRFQFFSANQSRSRITNVEHFISRGDYQVQVSNATNLAVGMKIEIFNKSNENIQPNMPNLVMNTVWTNIVNDGIVIQERHVIDKIEGNIVTFKNPMKINIPGDIIKAEIRAYNTIEEVGIEGILFTSGWGPDPTVFVHHASDFVDYAWRAVYFENVSNSWIRNVEFKDWNEALKIDSSIGITVKDITISGKRGHVSYNTIRSYGVLFEDCKDIVPGGQHHGPGMFAPSTGNVFLRSQMQQNQTIDCHGKHPYGNLYDDVLGGNFFDNGGAHDTYPNHAMDLVFWNFVHNMNATSKFYDFWSLASRKNHTFYLPKFIGFTSPGETVNFANEGLDELRGQQVYPQSLFDAQLQLRLYDGYMSASSSKSDRPAKHANDNDDDTRWNSNLQGVGQWLMLDFGINKSISKVTLKELFDRIDNWKLEYWNGTSWQILTAGNEIGNEKIITFNTVDTRKIRFTVLSMLPGTEGSSVSISTFKIGGTLSIDDRTALPKSIKAYPNPSIGRFTLDLPSTFDKVLVEVYNSHSQLIFNKTYPVYGGKVELNIEDKPSGIYFVKVNVANPVFIKLIKK